MPDETQLAELGRKLEALHPKIDDETATDAECEEFVALVNAYHPCDPHGTAVFEAIASGVAP